MLGLIYFIISLWEENELFPLWQEQVDRQEIVKKIVIVEIFEWVLNFWLVWFEALNKNLAYQIYFKENYIWSSF